MLCRKDLPAACWSVFCLVLGLLALVGFHKKNMNVLDIIEHPAPVLRRPAAQIDHIDESVVFLADAMIATLRYRALVDFFVDRSMPRGLAAPQVGVARRLIVCGISGRPLVMINPEILERKGIYRDHDDCLSVAADDDILIERSRLVKVKYRNLQNQEKILVVKNDAAALVEHEIDHLNGVLNIDY